MAVKDKLGPEELKHYYDSADGIKLIPGWGRHRSRGRT